IALARAGTLWPAATSCLSADLNWAGACSRAGIGSGRGRARGSTGMNAASGRFRRWAVTLASHAARVLPGVPSSWAQAMRHELDYITDDKAALRWAFGCILASYKARFM